MRPPALNDLSIAMSVIGLREHYENLSAQKRRVSFFHGRTTTPSVNSVATVFLITARERCWGITFVGGELFQRSRSMLQLDAQNSGLFLVRKIFFSVVHLLGARYSAGRSIIEGILRDIPYSIDPFKKLTTFFDSVGINVFGDGVDQIENDKNDTIQVLMSLWSQPLFPTDLHVAATYYGIRCVDQRD